MNLAYRIHRIVVSRCQIVGGVREQTDKFRYRLSAVGRYISIGQYIDSVDIGKALSVSVSADMKAHIGSGQ